MSFPEVRIWLNRADCERYFARMLRKARHSDAEQIIALIGSIYQEYGERIMLGDADKDLTDIEANYPDVGGDFVVWEVDGQIVGTHAILPGESQAAYTRRFYLAPAWRGSGIADQLMDWAVEWAVQNGFVRVELWTDTRFERSHSYYTKRGFRRTGGERQMVDGFEPYREWHMSLDLKANREHSTD
ncbi:MAG: GNAT family N-acetyltransferase [Myxococcales bacterium]|nr:GNAT family N-acetyltransferase [Myxococcales bacterium]